MLTIRQTEHGWELLRDGVVLTVQTDNGPTSEFARYEDAIAVITTMIAATLATPGGNAETVDDEAAAGADGLLDETWESPPDGGICFSEPTGDGRDFSGCAWSWRDPATAFVPLMLQTSTEIAHFGATLAGFATEIFGNNGTPGARGRFFDSEAGRQFRDMLLDGRRFTVSVDPGAVTYEDECLEVDDDGWCAQWRTNFLTYQIIGITGTPFAGFENASIQLGPTVTDAEDVAASAAGECGCEGACSCDRPTPELSTRSTGPAVVHTSRAATDRMRLVALTAGATATIAPPLAPPRRMFDDPGFVMPTPLTITDQGRVLGHVETGGCHTGYPDRCVAPPRGCDFQDFLQGRVFCDDGEPVRTGVLTWRMDHPSHELSFLEAMAAYGDSRCGWADVTVGYDRHGTWISGVLRPDLTDVDIRILRALSLSGDWRIGRRTGRHELIGVLAVNYPGFPHDIAASAITAGIPAPRPRYSPLVITAAGMVPQTARREPTSEILARIEALEARQGRIARSTLAGFRAEKRERDLARLRGV
jgi:hypothetical protein